METRGYTQWSAKCISSPKGNKIFEEFDLRKYNELGKKFMELSKEEMKKYNSRDAFIVKSGGPELNNLRQNYKKIVEEMEEEMSKDIFYDFLPIDIYMQKNVIMDLLMSLENENYIKEIYKKKKLKVTGGINTKEAIILMDCLRQGRSLLQVGSTAEILSKPLIDFYASSAYAYAIIVINSPLHKSISSLKGSHGHTYNHKNGTIDFGGTIPSGTFIDLLFSMPVIQINGTNINFKYKALNSLELVQNHTISISLLTLLSMVPELQVQYQKVDEKHIPVHKLSIRTGVENAKASYIFDIGDGKNLPDMDKVKKSFNVSDVNLTNGCFQISIAADTISEIMPLIYQDVNGKHWYIESPIEGFILPEICLHFLIISALCNIMRYSPYEWSDILSNKISPNFSLLINRYLRLFEQKFPMLVAQYLTNYIPILE